MGRNNGIDNHDNNNDKNNINSEDNSTTRNEYYDKVGQEELLEILRGALGTFDPTYYLFRYQI